ncbi:MAG: post-PEP-CTERM-1 domain-containing protein [Thermoanaerobaculia bacterium]
MKATVGVLVVSGVLVLSSPAFGEEPKSTAPAAESAGKAAPRMIIVKDPVTGELRAPTAQEIEALRSASPTPKLSVGGQPTSVEKLLSGRVRARLGPEYMRFSVVRKNPDGTISTDCVPGSKVDGALSASAPAAKSAAEEK